MDTNIQTKDSTSKLDYQAMWANLRKEMEYLIWKNVQTIHPTIILAYMGFGEQIEQAKKEECNGS